MGFTLFPPRDEEDLTRAAALGAQAFSLPPALAQAWLTNAGREHVRLFGDATAPASAAPASLLLVPMGHFFGGRPVGTLGLAGVAVAPEHRGAGVGRALVRAALEHGVAEGLPLSSLFPSSVSFYRGAGYELAGHHCEYLTPLVALPRARPAHTVVRLAGLDERVRRCAHIFAERTHGALLRGPYVWGRVLARRGEPFEGYGLLDDAGALTAYAFVAQRAAAHSGELELVISDLAFLDEAAGTSLLAFFKGFGTVAQRARFTGGATHPLLALLGDRQVTTTRVEHWMLRLLDPTAALTARGYPRHTVAALVLEVTDSAWPERGGTWTLEVAGGRGVVSEGAQPGLPRLACGPRGLAALYSGFLSPAHARLTGLVRGNDEALEVASGLFVGGPASCSDYF